MKKSIGHIFLSRLKKAPQWIRLVMRAMWQRDVEPYAATSMDLCDDASLCAMIGRERPQFASRLLPNRAKTIVGWGRKWSGRRAVEICQKTGQDLVLVEDGFLRSVDRTDNALSYVLDDRGIYYDAKSPSQLETLIAEPLTPEEEQRAQRLITLWRQTGVSKYNGASDYAGQLPDRYVLVIDQVAGDASIQYGDAGPAHFSAMLQAALDENPDLPVLVKVHPDVHTLARAGHFDVTDLANRSRVHAISDNCHPTRLIEGAASVYTVTSQMGFEALIWGKSVRCFGMPFYAGYGLTDDHQCAPERRKPVTLQQLVHAVLVKYPRYIDPETKSDCAIEMVMAHLGLQRRHLRQTNEAVYALGFSRWKRQYLRRFLPGPNLFFVQSPRQVPIGATVAVWGDTVPADIQNPNRVIRVEDGFLRSIGLGADLVQPLSWVIDDKGIYYDPKRPSSLEQLLQDNEFDDDMLDRAKALRASLRTTGVSKYNLTGKIWTRPGHARRVILVPGQVENDASVRCGSSDIRTNMGLLCAVRAANPDAYILYKPHPDVAAGLRKAGKGDMDASRHCDEVVADVDTTKLLEIVDEVHTMTSLLGFEALLRDVSVTCYGQPFYAGWGLTTDMIPISRRTNAIGIDQLVAGALIAYPRYISRNSQRLTTPERAITELLEWRSADHARRPSLRRAIRPMLRFWAQSGLRRNA